MAMYKLGLKKSLIWLLEPKNDFSFKKGEAQKTAIFGGKIKKFHLKGRTQKNLLYHFDRAF
jgi:hypothetical protein